MTTAAELDERYGRTRGRRMPWIVGVVVAVLVIGGFGWMTVSQSMASVDSDDLGFDLDAHTVTVRFQVTGVQGTAVTCVVEALDEEFGVVGWKIVKIPAGDSHSQALSTTVPTVAAATTGLVKACWVA